MNYYMYRLPGKKDIVSGMSKEIEHEVNSTVEGFAIFPFDKNGKVVFIPKQYSVDLSQLQTNKFLKEDTSSNIACASTSQLHHEKCVMQIVDLIKSNELDKCVLAKTIVRDGHINILKTFNNLCDSYPDAFVFFFYTSETGAWLGASPELLLSKRGSVYKSMALAGTKNANDESLWDQKNFEEHQYVSDYIYNIFKKSGLITTRSATRTKHAGPVDHLVTDIQGVHENKQIYKNHETFEYEDASNTRIDLEKLASHLSPTPALSGMPVDKAIDLIKKIEDFERGYYGGFIGPIYDNGDYDYFVNLRSAQFNSNKYCIFAGGGIVRDSKPEMEWVETESKAATILNKIILH